MRTEVFIRQLQCKVETFLARKGTKSHISLSQNISNITFGKVQTVSPVSYTHLNWACSGSNELAVWYKEAVGSKDQSHIREDT